MDEPPPSLKEITAKIPKDCFSRQTGRSLYFVLRDAAFCACLALACNRFWHIPFLFIPYAIAQGTIGWAIFVLGHDCGHGSFSPYPLLNDVIGTLLHSLLLVPYYQWKLTHRHHHKNTGHVEKDEVYRPIRVEPGDQSMPTLPYFGLAIGWFIYLVRGYDRTRTSHFWVSDPRFMGHYFGVTCSLLCCSAVALLLLYCTYQFGLVAVLAFYVGPWLVFGSWLVITTFLHHHDTVVSLPWYGEKKWSLVLGNLSTIDRHYGVCHELTHNIGTHQIHHLFPLIPHYHLEEATAAFRAAFPALVHASSDSIWSSMRTAWKQYERHHIVTEQRDILRYPLRTVTRRQTQAG